MLTYARSAVKKQVLTALIESEQVISAKNVEQTATFGCPQTDDKYKLSLEVCLPITGSLDRFERLECLNLKVTQNLS
jgi:hypothetical protein